MNTFFSSFTPDQILAIGIVIGIIIGLTLSVLLIRIFRFLIEYET